MSFRLKSLTAALLPFALVACSSGGDDNNTPSGDPATGDPTGPYPIAAVWEAYWAVCSELGGIDAMVQRASEAGWDSIADPAATPMAPVFEFLDENLEYDRRNATARFSLFTRTVGGEEVYLLTGGIEASTGTAARCWLYDVGESRRINSGTIIDWVGSAPDRETEDYDTTYLRWNSDDPETQNVFVVTFIPPGHPRESEARVSGLSLRTEELVDVPAPANDARTR